VENPTASSSPSSSNKFIAKRIEWVDLTDFDKARNIVVKEGKPFKVTLSFNEETGTLRIHLLEIVDK
jgi:hypothetical protein